ncbi:MAG TPA: lysylphosphatidylglycerol synthase transmembrane domain-containing protein [Polyangia bacterium]|nr:lysylphosphatidylglycerol synthase transmembrane domain-containing protein [Polyangia bacterium]
MNGRMALKLALSLGVGAVCVVYAMHGMDRQAVGAALRALPASAIGSYLVILAVTHLFRAWRWEFLLRPLGVSLPLGRLLLISSAGFMAILALPVRLGEFVRPYFVTRERRVRMSAALGTVAVERIIDGLLISILFFVSYLVSAGDRFTPELRFAAWVSLLGFVGLTTFLALARVWTEQTIGFALRVSLLQYLAPARAHQVADKLRALISGFHVLADRRNFGIFLGQSVLYWGINGFGMWLLARQMGLPISLGAAYTTMAFTGVVLSLPNAPGLVGQFHAAIKLGLLAYLPASVVNARGMAYAIVLHGIQTVWYVAVGLLSLPALSAGGSHTSLAEAVRESNRAVEAGGDPSAARAGDGAVEPTAESA